MTKSKWVALVFAAAGSVFSTTTQFAFADGEIGSGACGLNDPVCSANIWRRLASSRSQTLGWNIYGGARFGAGRGTVQPAVGVEINPFRLNMRNVGDVQFLTASVTYVPGAEPALAGNFQVNIRAVDLNVLFVCRASDGGARAPLAGLFNVNDCVGALPVGIAGGVAQVQVDSADSRVAVRWADIRLALNLIGSQGSLAWFRQNLQVDLGLSVDSLWYGTRPRVLADGTTVANETVARGVLRVAGRVLSSDNRWEMGVSAEWRPGFADFLRNQMFEAQLKVLHHLMLNHRLMMNFGLNASYTYADVPQQTFGFRASSSANESHGAFFGAFIEMPYTF